MTVIQTHIGYPKRYIKAYAQVKRNGVIIHYWTQYTPFGVEKAIQP